MSGQNQQHMRRAPEQEAIVSAGNVFPLKSFRGVNAHVDLAYQDENGMLVVVGWVFDPHGRIRGFAKLRKGARVLRRSYEVDTLLPESEGVQLARADRPDVTEKHGADSEGGDRHGFVLLAPSFSSNEELALHTKEGELVTLSLDVRNEIEAIERTIQACLPHSGAALHAVLQYGPGEKHVLSRVVTDLLLDDVQQVRHIASCDGAYLVDRRVVLLNGWIGLPHDEVKRVVIRINGKKHFVTTKLDRYARPDLADAFPHIGEEALGYVVAIPVSGVEADTTAEIAVISATGEREVTECRIGQLAWPELHQLLLKHASLYKPVTRCLTQVANTDTVDVTFKARLAKLIEISFPQHARGLPTQAEYPERAIVAIDRTFALGESGLLVFGWALTPRHKPAAVTVEDELGNVEDITGTLIPLVREDVARGYRQRFPDVSNRCGFLARVSLPTAPGEPRVLTMAFPGQGDVCVQLPTPRPANDGVALIKDILGIIPHPGQMNHELFRLFDDALGPALEAINQRRLEQRNEYGLSVETRDFGSAPKAPTTSVIVPLYGRFDFLRHQLAHFADDADFQNIDLIYVVDDPNIVAPTLSLAARYAPLFKVPFRVAWYGQNLGFAGANNVGVELAKTDTVVLLNSDVIPQRGGWVSTLREALGEAPDAGAVGPLLQFHDGSIQHAGMYPKEEPQLPGFLLNTHPRMGHVWDGDGDAEEHPMLTAACLMLRTRDYRAVGGLDEGYVIGDFEDSDLCLKLRKLGRSLYLAPKARLWHMERQSQNMAEIADSRQLITLFNGWRYRRKIECGELADPQRREASKEAVA